MPFNKSCWKVLNDVTTNMIFVRGFLAMLHRSKFSWQLLLICSYERKTLGNFPEQVIRKENIFLYIKCNYKISLLFSLWQVR